MGWWLKLVYWTDEREDAAYWKALSWISDSPGSKSPRWRHQTRPRRNRVLPPYGPRYEIGDRLVVCIANARGCPKDLVRRCPAILEVTEEPRWDPDLVDREGSRPHEGDRWAVVTSVISLHAVDPHDGPGVALIDVKPRSIRQQSHINLDDWQGQEAQRLLERIGSPEGGRKSSPRRKQQARVTLIPVEQGQVEGYRVAGTLDVKRACRSEHRLVADYASYLRQCGDTVHRHKIDVPGGAGPLYSDVFNETRLRWRPYDLHRDHRDI
jgi:hypothetical protein